MCIAFDKSYCLVGMHNWQLSYFMKRIPEHIKLYFHFIYPTFFS